MKKILSFILSILILGISFYACSEDNDSTNPTDNNNINPYFPYKICSIAKYKGYNLNDSGNVIEETSYQYQSVVKSKEIYKNKEALIFENQSLEGNKIGEEIFSSTKTQIFQYIKPFPDIDFDIPIDVPEDWYVIFDENKSRWNLYTKYFNNENVQIEQFDIILSDTFKIYVTYDGIENVTWGANNQNTNQAKVFTINYEYLGKASIKVNSIPLPLTIPFTGKYHFYYVKDIGIVKTHFENLNIEFMGSKVNLVNGFGTILLEITHPSTL